MRIAEIIATSQQPVFSFEFFPPRSDEGERNLRETLNQLAELEPAFASVTYGAGGSTRDRTLAATRWIKQELGIETMAHLTCVGASAAELRETVAALAADGIENVLALRGDPPRGGAVEQPAGSLRHAAELVRMTAGEFGLCTGAACFPEGHPDSENPLSELHHLKAKVQSGSSFLVTQMFFDNELYFRFVEAARFAGIEVPILPGIMPITSASQIETIHACGASLPPALLEQVRRRAQSAESVAQLGVAYATLQCADLLARGAPGIHFYTLNRSPATLAILSALKLQRPWTHASTTAPTRSAPRPTLSSSQALASSSA